MIILALEYFGFQGTFCIMDGLVNIICEVFFNYFKLKLILQK